MGGFHLLERGSESVFVLLGSDTNHPRENWDERILDGMKIEGLWMGDNGMEFDYCRKIH